MVKSEWGIVLTGGKAPSSEPVRWFLDNASCIVAADSGFDLARVYGVVPDVVVGDMDSLQDSDGLANFDDTKIQRYVHDKDETDTEIAIRTLAGRGFENIGLIGGGDGRLDHLLGIFSLFHRTIRPKAWVTNAGFVISVDSSIEVRECVGRGISFFPVGEKQCTMQSTGLKWKLDELSWTLGDCGVSNVITEKLMRVTVTDGRLIMVGNLDVLPGVAL